MNITFDKSTKRTILNALGMDADKEGYIIYLKTGKRVMHRDGKEVMIEEFAGVQKNYGIVRDDFNDIVALSNFMKETVKPNGEK